MIAEPPVNLMVSSWFSSLPLSSSSACGCVPALPVAVEIVPSSASFCLLSW
jgi:hypothetical protein